MRWWEEEVEEVMRMNFVGGLLEKKLRRSFREKTFNHQSLCMDMYVYIYIYTSYIIYIYIYICVCVSYIIYHTYILYHIYIYISFIEYIYICVCVCACVCIIYITWQCACKHICMHTCILYIRVKCIYEIKIYDYIHAYISICIYMYIWVCVKTPGPPWICDSLLFNRVLNGGIERGYWTGS